MTRVALAVAVIVVLFASGTRAALAAGLNENDRLLAAVDDGIHVPLVLWLLLVL
jgi:hypothetical protein